MDEQELIRGYCRMLDSCETRSRSELKQQHNAMIERLCRHARDTTKFYRDRLSILFDANDQFCPEAWDAVAPLTREELAACFEDMKSNNVPKNFGRIRMAQSSGSSGRPVRALWTDTQVMATHCVGRRLHLWHGVDAREFLTLVYATPDRDAPFESESDYWAPVYKSLGIAGRCVTLNGQLPMQHIRQRLDELKPDHLNINPRLLFAIANDYLAQGSLPPYKLKSVGTFGETRTELIDARIQQVFSVQPHARYTADEVGHVAIECPDCRSYHVVEEVVHADVVDADLKPVEVGEFGRILTTPLYSYAMPLIRYELGDEVTLAGTNCPRSQGTDIASIEGRLGDLFHHPAGGKFRPNRMILGELAELLDASAIQITQRALNHFVLRFQPKAGLRGNVEIAEIEQLLGGSFGFSASVDLAPVQEIPALANGKREDFVCQIESGGRD